MHSTIHICRWLRKAITTSAGEVFNYTNWDDIFAAEQIRGIPERLRKAEGFTPVNPCDLTEPEMDELGFGRWTEESPLRLIPLWLLPFLANEFPCGNINCGEVRVTKLEKLNNDHRFGCLAYGVIPKTNQVESLENEFQ